MVTEIPLRTRSLGFVDYLETLEAMKAFNARRQARTPDELWWLQHPPVYTQGLSCDSVTIEPSEIPIVSTDRGGQITYHGPGQLIVYVLIDIRRRGKGIKWLVRLLEQSVIDYLAGHGITGARRPGAPGIYVDGRKLAALGLRVRRGASYHGLSLNVDMDLAPFSNIHPCGYEGMEVVQLSDLGVQRPIEDVGDELTRRLASLLQHG